MADKIRVLLSEEEVNRRISEVAGQISRDYEGKELHLICILKGGVFFTCELAKRLTVPVSLDFMSVSSYGDDTKSSGVVRIVKDLDEPLKDKNVLIVEDIIDSGRTLSYLMEVLKQREPAGIRLCTLLDKPERRVKKQVKVDYTCFTIPDEGWIMRRSTGICPISAWWNSKPNDRANTRQALWRHINWRPYSKTAANKEATSETTDV